MTRTLAALIASHGADTPAIGAPGRDWLTFGGLRQLSTDIATQLRGFGIGATDRVAIVLPNGPEMAAAFVTIAQAAVTAPLNPAYQQAEYSFYLEDLRARALVVPAAMTPRLPCRAPEHGHPAARGRPATPQAPSPQPPRRRTSACTNCRAEEPRDPAHLGHTSRQDRAADAGQYRGSAQNILTSLALTPADRCLNVMPLFHIHGLIAAVSASLAAGASVACAPGFDALKFFSQMAEIKPTWYTAVPTMHQAILSRAARNAETIAANPLRFLRSSSASLPAQVMLELAATFNAPVIEAYGMTEATHQMACNPLPPRAQKPGSVGIAAGPLLRIAHEVENRLTDGTGEVVISGPNVTPGYEGNPDANAKNFFMADGLRWFRTGDQGALDDEGYLRLTGRLKEIINRGGEKISPLEVDGILLDHPAIQQVVAFAMPHPKLGEEVAAAVVLREGQTATEREIRDFCASRMADFKVPRRIVILDEIPKGATGKLQRIGLAEKLGLGATA